MPCELISCCQFFKDNMKELPKSAEYVQAKLCLGDYESCSRYRIYKEFGADVPDYLHPDDVEQVKKAAQCLRKKKRGKE